MRVATPLLASAWTCAAIAVVALPLSALAAEPIEVEVEVTPSTQPSAAPGESYDERDAAYIPPKVVVRQTIEPPSTDVVTRWTFFVLAILGGIVTVLGFIALKVVPAWNALIASVAATSTKAEENKHRIDRVADQQNQMARDMPHLPPGTVRGTIDADADKGGR